MDEIMVKLDAELAAVRAQIDDAKQRVKHALGERKALEAAEAELRGLRTRLGVLEANRAKLVSGASC